MILGLPFEIFILNIQIIYFKDGVRVTVDEMYGVDTTPNLKRNFWAVWSNASGLNITKEYLWDRRNDLTGVTIKATSTSVCL